MAEGITTTLLIKCPHAPVKFGIPYPPEEKERVPFSYGPTHNLIDSLNRTRDVEGTEQAVVCLSRGKSTFPFVLVIHGGWRYKENGFECKTIFVTFFGMVQPIGAKDRRFF